MRRVWLQLTNERGAVLILALFTMVFLMVAGAFLLRMSSAETDIAYNTVWGEGSFFAAEAGINVVFDQLGPTTLGPMTVAPTALDANHSYQGNAQFVGTQPISTYQLGSGLGYGFAGYVDHIHTITGSGTGPRSAQRQIEARVLYGPVPQ